MRGVGTLYIIRLGSLSALYCHKSRGRTAWNPFLIDRVGCLCVWGGGVGKLAKLAKLILRLSVEILTGFATFASCYLKKYFLEFLYFRKDG